MKVLAKLDKCCSICPYFCRNDQNPPYNYCELSNRFIHQRMKIEPTNLIEKKYKEAVDKSWKGEFPVWCPLDDVKD